MEKPNLVAVYGSLLSPLHNHGVMKKLGEDHYTFLGHDKTEPKFTLFPLGGFPGIHENGDTAVEIEVYLVSDELLEGPLDTLEGYDKNNPSESFYIRKLIPTKYGEAWIYIYNGPNRYGMSIEDGSWLNYVNNNKY